MNRPTHTLNPIQDEKFKSTEFASGTFSSMDSSTTRNWIACTTKYVSKSRMLSPNNRSMIIGGTAYYELLRDNYRPRGGKWVKITKEEAKAYGNDRNINKIFANDDADDSSSESEYVDIDEFEYDEDGHAIFPF